MIGVRRSIVNECAGARVASGAEERYLRGMRYAMIASCFFALLALAGCESNSTCQSGPKYGTQCYNPAQQTVYSAAPAKPAESTQATPMPARPMR
jgi:hypothetical protein